MIPPTYVQSSEVSCPTARAPAVQPVRDAPSRRRATADPFTTAIEHLVRGCVQRKIHADQITVASALIVSVAAAFMARGALGIGGWLYLAGASLDALDGRVARATGRGTPAGAFLDSTLDRVGELLVLGALALRFRTSPVLGALLVSAAASVVISYARARGEALGAGREASMTGLMQRPVRVALVGFACAASPIADALLGAPSGLRFTFGAFIVLAITTVMTATARVIAVYNALSQPDRR